MKFRLRDILAMLTGGNAADTSAETSAVAETTPVAAAAAPQEKRRTLNLNNRNGIAIRHFYTGSTLEEIDRLVDAAIAGGADEKCALGKRMLELISIYMAPDDVPIYRDALALFEEAGDAGNVEAMEMAVRLYASGLAGQIHIEQERPGIGIITAIAQPDWQKAYDWCVRAKDAGGPWATEIFPRLCADKEEAERMAATPNGTPPIPPPPA